MGAYCRSDFRKVHFHTWKLKSMHVITEGVTQNIRCSQIYHKKRPAISKIFDRFQIFYSYIGSSNSDFSSMNYKKNSRKVSVTDLCNYIAKCSLTPCHPSMYCYCKLVLLHSCDRIQRISKTISVPTLYLCA